MITPTTLSEQLLFSTVRIETNTKNGIHGTGTGFFFRIKIDENRHLPLIITNKHVTADAKAGQFFLHERDTTKESPTPSGQSFVVGFDNFESRWIGHPNSNVDLCAMPFGPIGAQSESQGKNPFSISLGEDVIWSDDDLSTLSAVEDVVMIGYPIGLWDEKNNLPIFRRGITATHPAIDFQGRSEGVIDIAVFPGSSGSPVLLLNENGIYHDKKTNANVIGHRSVFLGVLYAGPIWTTEGNVVVREIPTNQHIFAQVPVMINLGYMIKAKEVLSLAQHIKDIFLKDNST
jgi:hypothetical protein